MVLFAAARPRRRTSLANERARARYELQHYSEAAKQFWWSLMARDSTNLRVRIYFFLEHPLHDTTLLAYRNMWAWFMITLICSMMTVSMWRTHLKDSYVNTMWSADHDDVYVAVLMVLNFIYTLEFVLRVAAMTAPIGYVRTRRAFTRQLSWLSCDFVAITSTFVEPLCDRTSKTAMLLRLVSSMRAARVMRAIMRWSDGQLMVSTLWSS
jgi:hypothetical protein